MICREVKRQVVINLHNLYDKDDESLRVAPNGKVRGKVVTPKAIHTQADCKAARGNARKAARDKVPNGALDIALAAMMKTMFE